jgi:hypothetical protein
MRTATKLAVIGGGMLAALTMTAGPAQADPRGDPDVRAGCANFNYIGAQTGLWPRFSCTNWRANRNSTVVITGNGGPLVTPFWNAPGWPFTGLSADFWNGDQFPFADLDIDLTRLPRLTDLPPVMNFNSLTSSYTYPVRPALRPAPPVKKAKATAIPPRH